LSDVGRSDIGSGSLNVGTSAFTGPAAAGALDWRLGFQSAVGTSDQYGEPSLCKNFHCPSTITALRSSSG
jgi:hypothetical protein